jgi:hypothetical protein
MSHSLAGDGKSIALPSCRSVRHATIIPAHNLWGISGRSYPQTYGAIRGMPRAQKAKCPTGRTRGTFPCTWQSPTDLTAIPTFTKKLGHFGILRHHRFGAVIAAYIVPNPSIRIARPMGRLGNRLHRRLRGEMQIWNLGVNLIGRKAIDQNWET